MSEAWPEEVCKAVNDLEDKYDIELVSGGHHGDWVRRSERQAAEIEKLRAVLDAARLYEVWARKGDYPHDEQGCEAHEAIIAAVRALEQKADNSNPAVFNPDGTTIS